MSILLDQCVPRKFARLLKEWGYEATLLQSHTKSDAPDESVIQKAQELDAVLLTVDLDFANILDYPPKDYAGIVVLRYQPEDEAEITATLKQALKDLHRESLRGVLVIVSTQRYRIRRSDTDDQA